MLKKELAFIVAARELLAGYHTKRNVEARLDRLEKRIDRLEREVQACQPKELAKNLASALELSHIPE